MLGVGLFLGWNWLSHPRLDKLSPIIVEAGATVTLEGKNFGAQRGDSRVEVDGVAPTASSYLFWSGSTIRIRLPPGSESGLVYVVTHYGRSNAKLFLNQARLPVAARGEGQGGSEPFISAISSEQGPIGSRLVISGLNFGSNRETSAVLFALNTEGSGLEDRGGEAVYATNAEVDLGYESWSDKEIGVRVPDGASSGSLFVKTAAGRSNAVFFAVSDLPGQKRYKDKRSYALSYSVNITKVKAGASNDLWLWVPRPVQSASQHISRVLAQDPQPYVPDYRGTSLYDFKDLSTGKDISVSQSYLVQTWAVETEVDPSRLPKTANLPPLVAAYTTADDLVPAQAPEVLALARKIVQGEKNAWRQARLIWDWTAKNLSWAANAEGRKVIPALQGRPADSVTWALAACSLLRATGIPALPILGYLVDPSRAAVRHAWVEFYVYGIGWVPMDPVLGSGTSPGGFQAAFEDRARYFGNLDNRHLAFSRGSVSLEPMAATGRHASPQKPVALQSFYEEASGDLEAYSSFWSEVEISGLY